MSYEGYDEYLCVRGHYAVFDVYQDDPKLCVCGLPWEWFHSVDCTNGYDEDYAFSCDAPKREIGSDDVEQIDHKGNKYFLLRERYAPESDAWRKAQKHDVSDCLSAGEVLANEIRAAQAMSAGTAKTEGLGGDSPASAVRQDAPEPCTQTHATKKKGE